jgi:ApbE superfamily uncharacterized protein (UPF0280 family)
VTNQPRTYRSLVKAGRLATFTVRVKETDLQIQARHDLSDLAREIVLEQRGYLEGYIRRYPEFVNSLNPWPQTGPAPEIVRDMIVAGARAGVGPMAAVAGAVAEHVGRGLLRHSEETIIENGGDIFLKTDDAATVAVFAGGSPLSLKIGIRILCGADPLGVCTSSGSVGHSLSFGKADAVSVVARSCALADAAATAIGNRIQSAGDIAAGIAFGKRIQGVLGLLIVAGDQVGAWGEVELVPVGLKKG